jgi:hypothetical protein
MKPQISTGALTKKGTGYFITRFHQEKKGQKERGQEKRGQATFSSGIITVKELSSILRKKLPVPFFYYNDINHVLLDIPESLNEGVGIFYELVRLRK